MLHARLQIMWATTTLRISTQWCEVTMTSCIVKRAKGYWLSLPGDTLRAAKMAVAQPVVIKAEPGRIVIEPAWSGVVLANLLARIPAGTQFELVAYGVPKGNESPSFERSLVAKSS